MFNSITTKKIYQYVIEQIQEMILGGRLKKGDKLPSERELADQMNVSRTSVREGIRVLETMGIIESKQGEGNFICDNMKNSFIQPLSMMFILNKGKYSDIFELRAMLEQEVVRLAAHRGTEEEFEELKQILDNLKDTDAIEQKTKYDKEFHYKIVSMSKNYLIESMYHIISDLLEAFIENARKKIIEKYKDENILHIQHQNIYESIVNKNIDNAQKYMKEHIDIIKDSLDYI